MREIYILDLDDTLFPTTYYLEQNFMEDYIGKLSRIIYRIVYEIISDNEKTLYVVSNASKDWATIVLSFLNEKVSDIIRPRLICVPYEYIDRDDKMLNNELTVELTALKYNTFKKIIKETFNTEINSNSPKQVISIGDSEIERTAIFHVMTDKEFSNILFKNIKLQEKPTPNVLIEQLKAVKIALPDILNIDKSIFTRTMSKS